MKKNTIHKKASHFQKVKTRQELANEYGITTRTLNNRLKKANLYIPDGIFFPKYLS
jgi:transcriptional antiterminator